MLRKYILVLFGLLAGTCIAQKENNKLDFPDTTSANELIKLAEKNSSSNISAALIYAEKAIREGLRKNYLPPVIRGNLLLGRIEVEKNNTAGAYEYYQNAIKLATQTKDSVLLSRCYYSVGVIYDRLQMYSKGIEYVSRALKYARNSQADTIHLIICKNTIGHFYMNWFEKTKNKAYFESALKCYNLGLEYSRIHNQRLPICNGYANLANAHMIYFKIFNGVTEIRRSIDLSYQGLRYCMDNKHMEWAPIHYLNIGEANYYFGYYDSAIAYCKKAHDLHQELKHFGWLEHVNRDIALAYKAKRDYNNALKFIKEAIEDGINYHGTVSAESYRILSEIYSLEKNYIGALDAFRKFKEAENIDINSKRTLQLERLQIEYETTLKDREINSLNEKRITMEEKLSNHRLQVSLIFISLLLLLVICVFLILYSRNLKRSKELSDNARIMQEQFLANTSHEIRTPMNGIQGMVNLLLDSPVTSSQRQHLETIQTSSNHLLRIINDLLDLSKIKAGKIEFVMKNFRVSSIIRQLRELMQPLAEAKGLSLRFRIDQSAEDWFCGDDIRLEQILINLISNAIKFSEKGEILLDVSGIETSHGEKTLQFKITDSGIGIPKNKIAQIFDSFVQLENAGRRKQGGAGLGLSITKQLVELQNGKISVISNVGKGSEFVFSIPYKLVNRSEVISKLNTGSEKNGLIGKKILVVEDNEINQKVISNTLKSWKVDHAMVYSAVECFDQMMNGNFDLILMDIELPIINGWDATQYIRLKFDAPKKNIPIIALTAYASEDDKKKSFESGMNDIVNKPFNSEELYAKIHNLLNNRSDEVKKSYVDNKSGSFNALEDKYQDDAEGLVEIYNLFLSELPVYLEELKALNELSNTEGIKKQAHKMKSPVGLIGSSELLEDLNRLQEEEVLKNKAKRDAFIDHIIKETELLEEEISVRLKKFN